MQPRIVTTEEINQIVRAQKALDAVKDKEDEIAKSKRDQTSEAEKQAKLAAKQAVIMAGSNEQIKNMLKVSQELHDNALPVSVIHVQLLQEININER